MKKRLIALLLTTALAGLTFTACGEKQTQETAKPEEKTEETTSSTAAPAPEKEMTDITLNEVAHSIFYAPMYVAIEEGYFEEENIRLDLVFQRFFAKYVLDLDIIARMIFSLLPVKTGLVLSMDRTNWKFGEFNINILMLGITYKGIAFPLIFSLLPLKDLEYGEKTENHGK